MQHEIVCPICKKDLTQAFALLGRNPLTMWDEHMTLHKREMVQDLCFQVHRFKDTIQKDVRDAYNALDNGMKELNDKRHLIKATQTLG